MFSGYRITKVREGLSSIHDDLGVSSVRRLGLLCEDEEKKEYESEDEEKKEYEKKIKKDRKIICEVISKRIESGNILNASDIEGDWFPEVKADIFISHSHADIELAKEFSYWLNKKYGINAFVDGNVWSDIDDKIEEYVKKGELNRSQPKIHLHLILLMALAKMIDKCECFMFLETENSINLDVNSVIKTTNSPWLYAELGISNLLRKRKPIIRSSILNEQIRYTPEMNHLIQYDFKSVKKILDYSNKKCTHMEKLHYIYNRILCGKFQNNMIHG